ncbi:MAG: hypothetical protein ACR2QS_14245 [Woeseiaceae bacterium]
MNKKFIISWLLVFVAWMFGSFLVHGGLLGEDYAALTNLFRAEEAQMETFPVMLIAHIIMAGAFVWIYLRGRENGPWMAQGVRYGIAIALLAPIPTYMIYYAVQPLPADMVVKQIIGDGLLVVVLGVLTAFLNKPQAATNN